MMNHRERPSWRHVAAEREKGAGGADVADVFIALRMVLPLEGGEWEVKSGSPAKRPTL